MPKKQKKQNKRTKQKCPACDRKFTLPSLYVSPMLPPTGGDYEWVEGMVDLNCPHCRENLIVEVRQSLAGKTLKIGRLKFGHNPQWTMFRLDFSESGKFLAVNAASGVRVYEKQSPGWRESFQLEEVGLTCWDEDQLVIEFAEDDEDYYSDRTYQGWDILSQEKKWETKLKYWDSVKAIAVNIQQGILVRGGTVKASPQVQHLQVRDLTRGKTVKVPTIELPGGMNSQVYLNLKQHQALCVQAGFQYPNNLLQLWQFNRDRCRFTKVAEYSLGRSQMAWASWQPSGNILLVECHNYDGTVYYDNMPYGLVCLDGRTLAVRQKITQVDPRVCGEQIESNRCKILTDGEILWGSDRLYLLDAKTWEYRETLYYPDRALTYLNEVAVDRTGEAIAISGNNDVIVYSRNSQQGWSLRNQSNVMI